MCTVVDYLDIAYGQELIEVGRRMVHANDAMARTRFFVKNTYEGMAVLPLFL